MNIPKIYLKLSFSHSKWVLQAILPCLSIKTVFLAVQTLTPLFSLTVPYFVVFFKVIK